MSAAGTRIDPPVSVPRAKVAVPDATATAEPPLEPPATRPWSQALRVCGVVRPNANSWVWVLPSRIAPAALRRAATVLSAVARWSARTRELAVVAIPPTSIRSLSPIGMPCSGPR
ncbi:hypothetical protein GCM10020000_80760 [Streptomyces olivoverticillatus]